MAGSVKVSTVVSSKCITLKLFGRTLDNDAIMEPCFTLFTKNF